MALWAPAPDPKTLLGRHRPLAPSAAVKVSPLCLGAMNFGDAWKDFMGECDKKTTFEILDAFYEKGGNFIDTASNYQNEESEAWIGEWMEKRGVRDQIVLATKYTTGFRAYKKDEIQSNFVGNNTKNMRLSVEASLKKLKTSYIDLLYIHWWDFSTSIEEVMQSLNQLVVSGKVLYLGISDTPAWIVSRANQYARDHALRPFSVYQGRWSAAVRDFERDIISMCQAEGMGLCPWGSLGGGNFKTSAQRAELAKTTNPGRKMYPASETEIAVSQALENVANRHKTLLTSVALAYVTHKAPYVVPIVGGRKVEHLQGNIDALGLELTEEDIDEIEKSYQFDIGFPMNFLFRTPDPKHIGPADVSLTRTTGVYDYVEGPKPIRLSKK